MAVFTVAVVAVMAWRYLEAAMENFMLAADTLLVVSPVVDTAFTAKPREASAADIPNAPKADAT